MKAKIEQVIKESGLWDGGRVHTHGFLLSPSVFQLSRADQAWLDRMAQALHQLVVGAGRLMAAAADPKQTQGRTWDQIRRITGRYIPKQYRELSGLDPHDTPLFFKVDIMRDTAGKLWIAELDGHNKHGMGYFTLMDRVRNVLYPTQLNTYPGIAYAVAEWLFSRHTDELVIICGELERFYEPESRIFADELSKLGVKAQVLREKDILSNGNLIAGRSEPIHLLDFPDMSMQGSRLMNALPNWYRKGQLRFLIPPKPFFGSKGLLALVCNIEQYPEIEEIIFDHVLSEAVYDLREMIPSTAFAATPKNRDNAKQCLDVPYVLKEAISYGMKRMAFPEDPHRPTIEEAARVSPYRFVAQEIIQQGTTQFDWYDGDKLKTADDWYIRLTAHCHLGSVVNAGVTARRNPQVHGAKDCIQVATVLE